MFPLIFENKKFQTTPKKKRNLSGTFELLMHIIIHMKNYQSTFPTSKFAN